MRVYDYTIANCWREDSNLGQCGFIPTALCQVVDREQVTLIYQNFVSYKRNNFTQKLNIMFPTDEQFCPMMVSGGLDKTTGSEVRAPCVWIEKGGHGVIGKHFPMV